MKRIKDHDEQLGYFTFVQNNETTDYLKLAYACGLSLKATQSINKFAIAVDEATKECLEDKHYKVFDYVIDIPWGDDSEEDSWKLGNEWKAWAITPFKETVKLDCDMVFTRNVDHWWTFMREQEILITTNVRKLNGHIATSRKYRSVFDENELPKSDLIVLPGGFSYGDYLRCGSMASKSKIMHSVINFAKSGGLVMGICNGFQILVEAGLVPGVLLRNKYLQFICKNVYVKVENKENTFFKNLDKKVLEFHIAHNEGNYFTNPNHLKELSNEDLIAFKYCDKDGNVNESANPNGSLENIAGVENLK